MNNDRRLDLPHRIAAISASLNIRAVILAEPTFWIARRGGDIILVLGDGRPSGGARVKATRVCVAPVVDPFCEPRHMVGATGLVSIRHEHKRGMVAVGRQDALSFLIEPLVDWLAISHARPGGDFHGKIETEFIRRNERGLGRAEGMEADMVQTMSLADTDNALPRRNVRRGITGQWKDAAFECAAEKERAAIDEEVAAIDGQVAKAEGHRALVMSGRAIEMHDKLLQGGVELVPGLGVCTERDCQLGAARPSAAIERATSCR